MDATSGDGSRGFGPGPHARSSALRFAHQSRARFGLVIVGCWTIGFFGLSQGRFSVIQLLAALAGLVLWFVVGARRRRVESVRERWILSSGHPSTRPSTNVRRIEFPR